MVYFATICMRGGVYFSIEVSTIIFHVVLLVQFSIQTNATAPFVFLESINYIGIFNDNGFLLLKDFPIEMNFVTFNKGPVTPASFVEGLLIR